MMTHNRQVFGERLRALRQRRGLSQEELAHELTAHFPEQPSSQSNVSAWENRPSLPRGDVLTRLSEFFSVDMHYWITEAPPIPPAFRSEIETLHDLLYLFCRVEGDYQEAIETRAAIRAQIEHCLDRLDDRLRRAGPELRPIQAQLEQIIDTANGSAEEADDD